MHIIHLYIILMEVMSYYYSFQCDGLGGGGMPVLFNVHNHLHCIVPSLLSNDSKERGYTKQRNGYYIQYRLQFQP